MTDSPKQRPRALDRLDLIATWDEDTRWMYAAWMCGWGREGASSIEDYELSRRGLVPRKLLRDESWINCARRPEYLTSSKHALNCPDHSEAIR